MFLADNCLVIVLSKMLFVAEELAFREEKPRAFCVQNNISFLFKRPNVLFQSMTFKRSCIGTLKSKNIPCIERAVTVALNIFFHVKLLMCLTSALGRF